MITLLIVEDQTGPLEALECAVKSVCPKYFSDFQYTIARSYETARQMISREHTLVLLDHRLPLQDAGDLEDTDFERFSASLRNVGYGLIQEIRKYDPNTLIIGTSSLSPSEREGQPKPDFTMSKQWGQAEKDLDRILIEVVPVLRILHDESVR